MFSIGQKVVCIEGHISRCGVRLIDGKTYIVNNIWSCKCNTLLDVGITISTNVRCFKCNTFLSSDGTWWLYSKKFVPLKVWQNAEENVIQLLKDIREPVLL